MKKTITFVLGVLLGYATLQATPKEVLPYKNPNLPVEERVEDLLKRMTVEEKFWQIYMMPGDLDAGKERFKDGIFGFQVSTVGSSDPQMRQMLQYNPKLTVAETVKKINRIQRYFVEETRLGIPVIIFDEALHGLVRGGATAFPQSIALAATFDTTLVSRVSAAIARETASRGIRQVLSPVVNPATDVRWGRVEETYGEDPCLSAGMGVSFVKNFGRMGVITTPKHFVANSGDGGRDSNPVHYTGRFLEETHLVPFKACFRQGGSQSVMTAYNMLDGTPCTANSRLNIEKLRREWGFDGFTIADADAVGIIHKLHHTIGNRAEAGATAVNNGLDVIFQTTYEEHEPFLEACRSGLITEEALNRAVRQVLKAKFRLGLFDRPYVDEREADRWNACAEHRALTREAACRSMVLLKNENGLLPLPEHLKRIALIGQDAAEARLGGYSGPGVNKVSMLQGLKDKLSGRVEVIYEEGCKRINPQWLTVPADCLTQEDGKPGLAAAYFNNIRWEGAPALRRTDRAVQFSWTLFAPDSCLAVDWFSVEWNGRLKSPVTGDYRIGLEGNDGYQLWIDGRKVIDRPEKASFRTETVPLRLEEGREYAVKVRFYENTRNARIRLVWNVGAVCEDASIGRAVQAAASADVAVVVAGIEEGEFRDRGYLTLPGRQEELIQRVAATGKPVVVVLVGGSAVVMSAWLDDVSAVLNAWYPGEEGEPLFPFGYGLSYTEFEYGNLQVQPADVHTFQVSFTVRNAGKYAGYEVPQLYLRDKISSVTQPITRLIHYTAIHLNPGESKTVTFRVDEDDLSMLNRSMQRVVEPGDFRLMIGRSCKDIRLQEVVRVEK